MLLSGSASRRRKKQAEHFVNGNVSQINRHPVINKKTSAVDNQTTYSLMVFILIVLFLLSVLYLMRNKNTRK